MKLFMRKVTMKMRKMIWKCKLLLVKFKWKIAAVFAPFLIFWMNTASACAAGNEMSSKLNEMSLKMADCSDYLSLYRFPFIGEITRSLGWNLTRFLAVLVQALSDVLDKAFSILYGFTIDSGVQELVKKFTPVLFAVLSLSLVIYGINRVINPEFKSSVFHNILFGFIVAASLGGMISAANSVVKEAKSFIIDTGFDDGMSSKVVANGIVDLKKIDSLDWNIKKAKKTALNYFNASSSKNSKSGNVWYIDPTEVVDSDSQDLKNPEYFSLKLSVDNDGNMKLMDLNTNSWFNPMPNEKYYRYTIDYFAIWIALIAFGAVYFFSSFKVVKLAWDIVTHEVIIPFLAFGDIQTGKKLKHACSGLVNTYLIVMAVTLLQQLYFLYYNYLLNQGWNSLVVALFLIFGALIVIDGPNLFEQIFGIDAGLKSAFAVMGVARGVSAVGRAASNGYHRAASAVGAAGGSVAGAGGSVAGYAGAANAANQSVDMNNATSNSSNDNTTNASQDQQNNSFGNSNNNQTDHISGNPENGSTMGSEQSAAQGASSQDASNREDINSSAGITPPEGTGAGSDADSGKNFDTKNPNMDGGINGVNGKMYDDQLDRGSKNLTGQHYRGGIGSFVKQNTRVGQSFSKGQDFGNAVYNSLHRNTSPKGTSTSNSKIDAHIKKELFNKGGKK